jgi:hypothetical protein
LKEVNLADTTSFVPFEGHEGNGGGYRANQALTMHSEMMAINSALAASTTLANRTVSYLKPRFKLPGSPSKPGRLLRNGAVGSYVHQICLQAEGQQVQQGTGTAEGQEWRFEELAYRCDQGAEERQQQGEEEERRTV